MCIEGGAPRDCVKYERRAQQLAQTSQSKAEPLKGYCSHYDRNSPGLRVVTESSPLQHAYCRAYSPSTSQFSCNGFAHLFSNNQNAASTSQLFHNSAAI